MIVDCHLHIYPHFDEHKLLSNLYERLNASGPKPIGALLVERHDCWRFKELATGQSHPSPGWSVEQIDNKALRLINGEKEIYLFAGRQIVTQERIEVLAYLTLNHIPDGLPLSDVSAQINECGGVIGFSWAPGKWLGERGEMIKRYITSEERFVLCDSTLRPLGWPTDEIFKLAQSRGVPVLAGSDPLPMTGEESQAGKYAIDFTGVKLDSRSPSLMLHDLLLGRNLNYKTVGGRPDPLSWAFRYGRFTLKGKK